MKRLSPFVTPASNKDNKGMKANKYFIVFGLYLVLLYLPLKDRTFRGFLIDWLLTG